MKEDECVFTNRTAALNWSIFNKVSLSFLRRYQQLLGNNAPSKKGLRKQIGWSFESMLSNVLVMMDGDALSSRLTLVPKKILIAISEFSASLQNSALAESSSRQHTG